MHTPSLTAPSMRLGAPRALQWIGRRTVLLLAAVILSSGAAALGWPWLVAAGIAPLILAIAPCVAMCTLGVCMRGMGNSCPNTAASNDLAGRSEPPLSPTHGHPS